jgi:hypothetical protein
MSATKTNPIKRQVQRRRNFRAEYQARLAKGLAAGKSRSAARGHARAADLPKPLPAPIDRNDPREQALKLMRRGATQKAAATETKISVEQLRRYQHLHTSSRRVGRKWDIFDLRPQSFWIATNGRMKAVTLANDEGSLIGHYWNAVNEFLATNKRAFLEPYEGLGVRDINGKFWPFEVRPNVLWKLDGIGELHFLEIYANVAPADGGDHG